MISVVRGEDSQGEGAGTELSHELVRFARMLHVARAELAEILPHGLDPAAAQLLSWLVKKGPSRQGELAEATFLDPSTVSRRISQLVAKGLVERQVDRVDGRAVQLVPTLAGQQLFGALMARREQTMREVLSDWPAEQVAALAELMRKFNDDFETHRFAGTTRTPEENNAKP